MTLIHPFIHFQLFIWVWPAEQQSEEMSRLPSPRPPSPVSVGTPKETGIGSRETCSTQHVLGLIQVSSQLGIPETSHLEGIQEPS